MTINEKFDEHDARRIEEWMPLFRPKYGSGVTFEEIECVRAGIRGSTHRVVLTIPGGDKVEHYITCQLGSREPVLVDGDLTKTGKSYVRNWTEQEPKDPHY